MLFSYLFYKFEFCVCYFLPLLIALDFDGWMTVESNALVEISFDKEVLFRVVKSCILVGVVTVEVPADELPA